MAKKIKKSIKKIREGNWPNEKLWKGQGNEDGWFQVPRTVPLILALLAKTPKLTGKQDLSSVYLELLSRHFDGGVIEMTSETDHAYAAGYWGPRGLRTWQERMDKLKELGFIHVVGAGNNSYKFVAIVHPSVLAKRLRESHPNDIPERWWNAYQACKEDAGLGDPDEVEEDQLAD